MIIIKKKKKNNNNKEPPVFPPVMLLFSKNHTFHVSQGTAGSFVRHTVAVTAPHPVLTA